MSSEYFTKFKFYPHCCKQKTYMIADLCLETGRSLSMMLSEFGLKEHNLDYPNN